VAPRLIRVEREMQPDWNIGEVVPALELNPDLVRRWAGGRVGRESEIRQNVGVARRLRRPVANVKGVRAKAARDRDAELPDLPRRSEWARGTRTGRRPQSEPDTDGRSGDRGQGGSECPSTADAASVQWEPIFRRGGDDSAHDGNDTTPPMHAPPRGEGSVDLRECCLSLEVLRSFGLGVSVLWLGENFCLNFCLCQLIGRDPR